MNAAVERRHQERYDSLFAQNAQILSGQRSMNEKLDETLCELNALRTDVTSLGPQSTDSEAIPSRRSRTRSRGRGHHYFLFSFSFFLSVFFLMYFEFSPADIS